MYAMLNNAADWLLGIWIVLLIAFWMVAPARDIILGWIATKMEYDSLKQHRRALESLRRDETVRSLRERDSLAAARERRTR